MYRRIKNPKFLPGARVRHTEWNKLATVIDTIERWDEGGDPDLIVALDDAGPDDDHAGDKVYRFEEYGHA